MSTILTHEVPNDIVYSINNSFPGFHLTMPTESVSWNNRSQVFNDILIDRVNDNEIVSFGLPKIFCVNEFCSGRNQPVIHLKEARVFAVNELIILSRYEGETYVRKQGEFPEAGLLNINRFPKIAKLFELNSTLTYSIIFHKVHQISWEVVAIIDHFPRTLRTPKELQQFCLNWELPIAVHSEIETFDLLKQASILYKSKYFVHYGSDIFQVEDNWFAQSMCLCSGISLEKVVDCWVKFPAKSFIDFKSAMLRISSTSEMLGYLNDVKAAHKILLTVLGVFAQMVKMKQKGEIPEFLKCFYWDVFKDQKPKESNLKKALLEIVRAIKTEKKVDKPLLLEYGGA